MKVLSMGWGVQTWTLAAMVALEAYTALKEAGANVKG